MENIWVTFAFKYDDEWRDDHEPTYRHENIPVSIYMALLQGGTPAITNYVNSNYCPAGDLYYGFEPQMKAAKLVSKGKEAPYFSSGCDMYDKIRISPKNPCQLERHQFYVRKSWRNKPTDPAYVDIWETFQSEGWVFSLPIIELRYYDNGFVTALLQNGIEEITFNQKI